jgi:hypothetical protein
MASNRSCSHDRSRSSIQPAGFLSTSAVVCEQLQASSKLNCDGVASAGGIRAMGLATP